MCFDRRKALLLAFYKIEIEATNAKQPTKKLYFSRLRSRGNVAATETPNSNLEYTGITLFSLCPFLRLADRHGWPYFSQRGALGSLRHTRN